jgi:DNA modification methylase
MAKKTDLDGRTWLSYSISVWDDIRKTPEEAALKHPALFPVQLAERLIQIFSHTGNSVLDPFCGTGSTLLAAHKLGRKGFGVDISEEYLKLARARLQSAGATDYQLIQGDARRIAGIVRFPIDLCLTSPPYWDILNQSRTADRRAPRHYGNLPNDLGNVSEYDDFLENLILVFQNIYSLLRPGGYCCIVIMDLRKKDRFYPLHMDLVAELVKTGFTLDDMIIWNRHHEYNQLRPLGYPYVFRVNRIHEYILIMQKRHPARDELDGSIP